MIDPQTGSIDPNHPDVQSLAKLGHDDLNQAAGTMHELGDILLDAGRMTGVASGPSRTQSQSLSGGIPSWISVLVQRLQKLGPLEGQVLKVILQYYLAQQGGQVVTGTDMSGGTETGT